MAAQTQAAAPSNADRATNLLNLLKFSQPQQGAQPAPAVTYPQNAERIGGHSASGGVQDAATHNTQASARHSISASDLVASFMSKSAVPAPVPPHVAQPTTATTEPMTDFQNPGGSPSAQTQDFLLKLLNRPKPAQSESLSDVLSPAKTTAPEQSTPEVLTSKLSQSLADSSLSKSTTDPSNPSTLPPAHVFVGQEAPPQSSESTLTSQQTTQPLFTYVNPFEQLAASSPRNRTPKAQTPHASQPGSGAPKFEILQHPRNASPSANGTEVHKRNSKDASPGPEHMYSRRKLTGAPEDDFSTVSSPAPAPLEDGRSQIEALIGIGASNKPAETVAEALTEVADQVNQEVEHALAKAEDDEDALVENQSKNLPSEHIHEAASAIKEELDKEENQGALEEHLPEPVADAVKSIIDEAAQANVADSWESADAEDSPSKDDAERLIRVYNLPLRPFITLRLKPAKHTRPTFKQDQMMDIARLKKEFDQFDRTLVTASEDHIVYGMSKHGGVRLIRQDDGRDKQAFPGTNDRIFNVSLSSSPAGLISSGTEAVLGTGVSGSVYWVAVTKSSADLWESDDKESHRFTFPPIAVQEDNSSGVQLKTRARTSSRHPEFFAVGRGKAIYVIWPGVAASPRYLTNKKDRVVDAERYLQERCLRIVTGKAGKDFVFSEDDSTIASLDKLGRLRIWDVRDLVDGSHGIVADDSTYKREPVEVRTPMMTFLTTLPDEKAWPSSVLFVDKTRPYLRGTAQRYVIVGMKQNHSLQLWDLALGKAVQELHFPHNQESDAICSLAYHPVTGIIVVGHPTRNSIYFIHLSAPRYNLSPVSQARYVERLAQKDPSLPKPEATAIMSGVREFSFSGKGSLLSLDILSNSNSASDEAEDPVLLELYIMHTKGVSTVNITREDLGWSKEGKVIHPVDAEKEGMLVIGDLQEATAVSQADATASLNGDKSASTPSQSTKATSKDSAKKSSSSNGPPTQAPAAELTPRLEANAAQGESSRASLSNGTQESTMHTSDKAEKKKKKRSPDDSTNTAAAAPSQQPKPSQNSSAAGKGATQTKAQKKVAAEGSLESHFKNGPSIANLSESINIGVSGDFLNKEIEKIEKTVSTEFNKVVGKELDMLYRRFDEDKRIQQAAGDAKQDAVLRLVSSTLSENVEKSLARMIGQSMQQVVLPTIADVTASSLHRNLSDILREQLHHSVPRELTGVLPEIIGRAMQTPDTLRVISELVANKVATHVENEFSAILHGTISPAFKDLALGTAQKMASEVERRTADQIHRAEAHRHQDSLKIDQLHDLVHSLTHTVSRMAEAQTDFQREILKLQRQLAQSNHQTSAPPSESSRLPLRELQQPSPAYSRQLASISTPAPSHPPQPMSLQNQQTPTVIPQRSSASYPQQSALPRRVPGLGEPGSMATLMQEGRYEEATIQVCSPHETMVTS